MREAIRDKERLAHILEAINIILENKDKYSFSSSQQIQDTINDVINKSGK